MEEKQFQPTDSAVTEYQNVMQTSRPEDLRLREPTTVVFADLEAHSRSDKRFEEILRLPFLGYDELSTHVENAKVVANQVVELLKSSFNITTHFVPPPSKFRKQAAVPEPINLYIVFDVSETSDCWLQSCVPKILNSIYFVLTPYSTSYKVEDPEVSTMWLTDLKSGSDLCMHVIPNNQPIETWNKVHSIFKSWPFSSLASITLEHVDCVNVAAAYFESLGQFTQNVITLAKIWNWNWHKTRIVRRSLALTEIIAIKAAEDETEARKELKSLTSALERFFKYMSTDFGDIMVSWNKGNRTFRNCVEDPIHAKDHLSGISYMQWYWLQFGAKRSLDLIAEIERGKKPADCLIGMQIDEVA